MKKAFAIIGTALLSLTLTGIAVGCQPEDPPHDHTYSSEWSHDDTWHWKEASCEHTDEVSERAKHSFGSWETVTEPTCEGEGEKARSCSCGYEQRETLASLGGHQTVRVAATEATCSQEGNVAYCVCEACDSYFTARADGEEIPDKSSVKIAVNPEAHTQELGYLASETGATHAVYYPCCNKQVDEGVRCMAFPDNDCSTTDACACGRVFERAKTHALQSDKSVWNTKEHFSVCTNEGCCYVEGTAHSYSEVVDAKYLKEAATCTTAAVYYKSCVCGQTTEKNPFPSGTALNHSFVDTPSADDWKQTSENHYLKCTRCAETSMQAAHVFTSGACSTCGFLEGHTHSAQTALSYDETGHYNACDGCDEKLNFSVHLAFEPIEAEAYEAQASTCAGGGKFYFSCECGYCPKESTFQSAYRNNSGHLYNKEKEQSDAVVIAGDCLHNAVYYKSCLCGAVGTAEYGLFIGKVNTSRHADDSFIYVKNYDGTHDKLHACCGAVAIEGESCYGGSATADERAVCALCDGEYGDKTRVEESGSEVGTLNVIVKGNELEVSGNKYTMYGDTLFSDGDVTLRLSKEGESEGVVYTIDSLRGSIKLQSGKYTAEFSYRNNRSTYTVTVERGGTSELTAYLSPVYLGGSVTLQTGSHTTATFGSSEKGWVHLDGTSDSVKFSQNAIAFQDGQVGTEYYVEATLDTTKMPTRTSVTKFAGLLLSHGTDTMGGGKQDDYLGVSIYGKSLVLCVGLGNWYASDKRIIANLDELGITFDASEVKLSAVRDGSDYLFFIDGKYVTSYSYPDIANASGFGVLSLYSTEIIRGFNYSMNEQLLDAFKALAPTTSKTMDLFVIAGQSNAAGISSCDYDHLATKHDSIEYGFSNIWLAGDSMNSSGNSIGHNRMEWQSVRPGMGKSIVHIGPELGMAAELADSGKYTGTSYAGFVKYAYGGTSLLEDFESADYYMGNWAPPSYQQYLKDSGVALKSEGNLTGGLYRGMIAEVLAQVDLLERMGFTVTIKGLFWMQGEANVWDCDTTTIRDREYTKAFESFAADTRSDLGAPDMKFFVGEVSRTFASAWNVAHINGFIAMQNRLPSVVSGCYVINSSVFDINVFVDGVDTVVGSDMYHWNQDDMYEIGKLVGQSILTNCYE